MKTCCYMIIWHLTSITLFSFCVRRCHRVVALSPRADCSANLHRLVCANERASLDDFYGLHFSKTSKRVIPPPPKEEDEIYTLIDNNVTLAAVRLTRGEDHDYVFLRSLCVSKAHRRRGLAQRLIKEAIEDYYLLISDELQGCYCFADASLVRLYQSTGFVHICADNRTKETPDWMWRLYIIVAGRLQRKSRDMKLLVRYKTSQNSVGNDALQVILVQHAKEQARPTSTASLLLDKDGDIKQLSHHLDVVLWSWSGRADNRKIERQLDLLETNEQRSTVLLWTGGDPLNEPCFQSFRTQRNVSNSSPTRLSFIVLDGTWQEARTIFRKMSSFLRRLPRATLTGQSPSNFTLRKDYTCWREKFRDNQVSGGDLLCTAEVVASLLEASGNVQGSNIVRHRLDEFQANFGKNSQHE